MATVEILWNEPTSYLAACVNALAKSNQVRLYVNESMSRSRLEWRALLSSAVKVVAWNASKTDSLSFSNDIPQIVLVSGWMHPQYTERAKALRGQTIRVMTFDTQWSGSVQQRIAVRLRRMQLRNTFDGLFVPGLRQAQFGYKLGFTPGQVRTGSYSCNSKELYSRPRRSLEHVALCAARLVPAKGITDLVRGFQLYRTLSQNPLDLKVAGIGPLGKRLASVPGIDLLGYLQPEELFAEMLTAKAFVLPSRREPWGVVLQEAAACGLPLIATKACGSTDTFLSSANGWLLTSSAPAEIASALLRLERLSKSQWDCMSQISRETATSVSPESWADTLESFAHGSFPLQ